MEIIVRYGPPRNVGPKKADGYFIATPCKACGSAIAASDLVALIELGPGDDDVERDRARNGGKYNAVAIEIHWLCSWAAYDPSISGTPTDR